MPRLLEWRNSAYMSGKSKPVSTLLLLKCVHQPLLTFVALKFYVPGECVYGQSFSLKCKLSERLVYL